MTKLLRHTILLLAAVSLIVACEDNAIPSDKLGTDGITQSRIVYDTIPNLREATGDTIDVETALRYGYDSLAVGQTSDKEFIILGAVKGISTPYSAQYGNISPILTNKLSNRQLLCYQLKSFKRKGVKTNFTGPEQLLPGDIVAVRGKIFNRYGTPQVTDGYLVYSDNPNSGYRPAPKVILSESFDAGLGDFTVSDKVKASVDMWEHIAATSDKQGYACANQNRVAEAAESWLISPSMDLTACRDTALLTYSQYYLGSASERDEQLQLMVSTDDGANWTQLPIPSTAWRNGKIKSYIGATIDLTDYKSATTKIAFVYKSSAESALLWAIQNLRIGEPEEE